MQNNLSKHERIALKHLRNNKNIIIKKADKNSGIVILNKTDYENKVMTMLADENVYTKLEQDDSLIVQCEVDKVLVFRNLQENQLINRKQLQHLTNYTAQSPVFYGIPKIHKTTTL